MKNTLFLKPGIFALLMFSFFTANSYPDLKRYEWFKGKIELSDGTVYEGKMAFSIKDNYVIIRKGLKVKSYSPLHVNYFRFYDKNRKMIRQFYTLPLEKESGYKSLMFFELLVDGPITLLNREVLIKTDSPTESSAIDYLPIEENTYLRDRYYILNQDGLQRVWNMSTEFFEFVAADLEEEMHEYKKEHNLHLLKRHHIMRMIYYYNDAAISSELTAMNN